MLGLVRAFFRNAHVAGLLVGKLGELDANLFKMQTSHFFVEFFGKNVDLALVRLAIVPQIDLSQNLIGKGVGHHKGWVPGCAAKIHQAAFS